MKKLSCGILLVTILGHAYSQDSKSLEHEKSIALKFAPSGLEAGKVTFGGEFNFKHRNSFTFLAGVPFDKANTVQYQGEKSKITSKAFSLMAGYRYYLGHKTMSGFYIEPYVKYLKLNASGLFNKELQGQQVILDTHAQYEGIGLGAQLGLQVMIVKRVALDFFLLGPEANSAKASTVSTDIADNLLWTFANKQQIEDEVKTNLTNDLPVIGKKIAVNVDPSKKMVSTSYSGFMPGLRVGASIGIRF